MPSYFISCVFHISITGNTRIPFKCNGNKVMPAELFTAFSKIRNKNPALCGFQRGIPQLFVKPGCIFVSSDICVFNIQLPGS